MNLKKERAGGKTLLDQDGPNDEETTGRISGEMWVMLEVLLLSHLVASSSGSGGGGVAGGNAGRLLLTLPESEQELTNQRLFGLTNTSAGLYIPVDVLL